MSGKAARSLQGIAKPAVQKTSEHDVTLQSQLAAIIEATSDGIALIRSEERRVGKECRL